MAEQNSPASPAPLVFVSYSHDSREHKRWVNDLASRLRANGIDAILDQWELNLGDDVPKFMEQSVTRADRVLMICTEPYVKKADDGAGGVGYEAMVVTGELIKNLGTSKFIPVIRQATAPHVLPKSMSTRFFVDLSVDHDFEGQFEVLLRELHRAPAQPKPLLGKNPYALTPSGRELAAASAPTEHTSTGGTIEGLYAEASRIAHDGDILRWRLLVSRQRARVVDSVLAWRREADMKPPTHDAELIPLSLKGVEVFAPLLALALAGVGSGRSAFVNQISLFEDILYPKGWPRDGRTVLVELPMGAAFVYQALHGAMCLQTDQLPLAIGFVRSTTTFHDVAQPLEVWRHHGVMGWPYPFAHNSAHAWDALISLPKRWPWLKTILGEEDDFLAALIAYYMALNVNEYAYLLKDGRLSTLEENKHRLDIPLRFAAMDQDATRRAYRLFTQDVTKVKNIWASLGVGDKTFAASWDAWMAYCEGWQSRELSWSRMPHLSLAKDVLR